MTGKVGYVNRDAILTRKLIETLYSLGNLGLTEILNLLKN